MPILSAFGAARTIPGSSGVVNDYSYDFNGSSYLRYPSSSSFAIGTQEFSIECFVYLNSYPSYLSPAAVILDFGYAVTSGNQRVQFFINSSGQPAFVRNNRPVSSSSTSVISSEALSLSTWTYIAVSRLSTGVVHIYVNNNVRGTASNLSGTISSGTGVIPSVGTGSVETNRFLDGKISNLRFNLGSSISTATVPTSPLTAQATTKMLTCQSSTVKDNSVANGGGPWTLTNSGVLVSTSGPF